MSVPRWIGLAAAGAAFLLLADAVAWHFASARLAAGWQSALGDLRAGGWTVRCSAAETGGWPFSATLAVADVHIDGGSDYLPAGVSWGAERLVLAIAFTDPLHLSVSAQGEETLRISHLPAVVFTGDRIEARVPLGRGRDGDVGLAAVAVTGGLQASHRQQDVRIGDLAVLARVQAAPNHGFAASLTFTASDIGLPDTGRWPLGGSVNSLAAAATLTSPPVSGADSRAQAESWRDGGGGLTVHTVDLHWGPLSLQGDARLGLDSQLQPAGTGNAHVLGYAQALDALAAAGVIGPGMAVTYKAVLGLMAHGPEAAINVPLTLRDSTLSLGQIPLARFRDVVWK